MSVELPQFSFIHHTHFNPTGHPDNGELHAYTCRHTLQTHAFYSHTKSKAYFIKPIRIQSGEEETRVALMST